jgi:predicted heme/steroid binding protein
MPAKANAASVGGGKTAAPDQAAEAHFTREALARFDGTDPRLPVLIAYHGRIYDVSQCFLWRGGRHFWHRAGCDLTDAMAEAPHTEALLTRAACVGIFDPD